MMVTRTVTAAFPEGLDEAIRGVCLDRMRETGKALSNTDPDEVHFSTTSDDGRHRLSALLVWRTKG